MYALTHLHRHHDACVYASTGVRTRLHTHLLNHQPKPHLPALLHGNFGERYINIYIYIRTHTHTHTHTHIHTSSDTKTNFIWPRCSMATLVSAVSHCFHCGVLLSTKAHKNFCNFPVVINELNFARKSVALNQIISNKNEIKFKSNPIDIFFSLPIVMSTLEYARKSMPLHFFLYSACPWQSASWGTLESQRGSVFLLSLYRSYFVYTGLSWHVC